MFESVHWHLLCWDQIAVEISRTRGEQKIERPERAFDSPAFSAVMLISLLDFDFR